MSFGFSFYHRVLHRVLALACHWGFPITSYKLQMQFQLKIACNKACLVKLWYGKPRFHHSAYNSNQGDALAFRPLCHVLAQPVHFTRMFPTQLKGREYEVGLLVHHLFWNRIHEHTISLRLLGIILKVLRLEVYKPVSNHFCLRGGGSVSRDNCK